VWRVTFSLFKYTALERSRFFVPALRPVKCTLFSFLCPGRETGGNAHHPIPGTPTTSWGLGPGLGSKRALFLPLTPTQTRILSLFHFFSFSVGPSAPRHIPLYPSIRAPELGDMSDSNGVGVICSFRPKEVGVQLLLLICCYEVEPFEAHTLSPKPFPDHSDNGDTFCTAY
jgi:hypothetical protein